jgi:hypothetical protein
METEDYEYTFEAWAEAFTIFAKYNQGKHACVSAAHDELWAGPKDCAAVSDEDKARLKELGWDYTDDFGFHKTV